jgi:hypothetical protein
LDPNIGWVFMFRLLCSSFSASAFQGYRDDRRVPDVS